jgi:hypothetical protein
MIRPSDLWAPFQRDWYDDETGELQEPHRSNLIQAGISLVRIAEMEAEIRLEIAGFHQKNAARPLIKGKNWSEQQLELRQQNSQLPAAQRQAIKNSTFDPDHNY